MIINKTKKGEAVKRLYFLCLAVFISHMVQGYPYLQPFAPYYSQCGQDKYVNEVLLHNKRNGIFVDIGAHDGISYSNTYYFEKELGWTGICIEPHPDRFAELEKNRSATCIKACVANFTGTADFLKISGGPEMLSGLVNSYDSRHQQRIKDELVQRGGSQETIKADVFMLNEILQKHGIKHIDLLSVDTEGSEWDIIKSIDFEKFDIDVIVVENNFGERKIYDFLTQHGYRCVASLGGDQVYKKRLSISLSQQEKTKLDQFAQVAFSTRQTVYSTYQMSLKCIDDNISGDFVECGVAAGTQVAAMAYACQQRASDKKVHLYDSFEGIPLAGPNDTQQPGVGEITHDVSVDLDKLLVSSGITVCSLEDVQLNMFRWAIDADRLEYHKGWFQHVLPRSEQVPDKICFLRLDGDLYESTRVCLEYLYPKVVKGGYVVIDDYSSLDGCRKAVHEYLDKHNLKPQIIKVPGGQGPVYWQVL